MAHMMNGNQGGTWPQRYMIFDPIGTNHGNSEPQDAQNCAVIDERATVRPRYREQNQMPKTKKSINQQLGLFKADVSWFHIFKEMIKNKTWANMSPSAKALYPVLKAFTNWKDGRAFPTLDTLQEYSGLARTSISRALKELEKLGYIKAIKGKGGRSSNYKLVEKFQVEDSDGRPAASVSFDYLPAMVKDAVAELKHFAAKGLGMGDGKFQYIHIENLTLHVAGRDVYQNQTNIVDSRAVLKGIQDRIQGKDSAEAKAMDSWNENSDVIPELFVKKDNPSKKKP